MNWSVLIFTVATLKTLRCTPYRHHSYPDANYPFFPDDSPGFHSSRSANRPGGGIHTNEFWNPDHFPHIGPTVHGPQIDINSESFRPSDDILPFGFGNGPSRDNSFPWPQPPRRPFNGRPNGFIPSRDDDSSIGRPQPGGTFNERPNFSGSPSRQNTPGRPQFDGRPTRQNPPGRPQPGRPFNGRPSVNLDSSRQNPSPFIPSEGNDREEVFIFDRPTSPRPPITTGTTATTTTTPRNCDCPTTPEFNPVCGSNGQTYTNLAKLKCAVKCGTDVRLDYYGSCSVTTESSSSTSTTTVATPARNNLF